MSLAGVIFPTGEYSVKRTNEGTYVNGDYVPGAEETLTIVAGIQPLTGRELQNLRRGITATEVRVVYTNRELIALDETAGIVPDIITVDGDEWRVFKCERFRILANRWRAYIERVGAAT